MSTAKALLLFGATGDLAQRMLLPSLFGLHADGLVDPALRIIGTARSDLTDDAYRRFATEAIEAHVPADRLKAGEVAGFAERLRYVPLDASAPAGFGACYQTFCGT